MTFEEALRDVSTDFSDNWGGISRAAAMAELILLAH